MAFKKPLKTELERGIKPGLTPANAKSESQTQNLIPVKINRITFGFTGGSE